MSKIFITGTNRGLGLEFVKQFLNRGDEVIATCRNSENARELNQLQDNPNLEIFSLDVGNHNAVQKLQQQLADQPIDIFINNAGIWRSSQLGNISIDEWMESFRINSIAPIKTIESFLPNIKVRARQKSDFHYK